MKNELNVELDISWLDEEVRQGLLSGRVTLLDGRRFKCPGPNCGHSNANPFDGLPPKKEDLSRERRRCPRCRRKLDFILDHRGDTDGTKGVVYCLFIPGARITRKVHSHWH